MLLSKLTVLLMTLVVQQAQAAAIQVEEPAALLPDRSHVRSLAGLQERADAISCSGNIPHLSEADCHHLARLGFEKHGVNAGKGQGSQSIWVGGDGKYKAVFKNSSGKHVILVVWNEQFSFNSSFVVNHQPRLTVSMNPGASVTVSFSKSMSGAWSGIYPQTAMHLGQVGNTWGEFTTGQGATADVSREVNMKGNSMSIKTPGGCTSNMNECVFVCKSGNTCGGNGTYALKNTGGHDCNKGGTPSEPSGGCQGWPHGALQVALNA